jgi:hypothetical protein
VNEYTRREEVRWTLVASLLMVMCIAPAVMLLAINAMVAWYWLHDWLQGFAYRITLSPLYFVAAGVAALVIAWATIRTRPISVVTCGNGVFFTNHAIDPPTVTIVPIVAKP